MIKFKLTAILTAGALLLSATAFGQIKKSGAGYLLRFKYKAGAVRKYTLSTKVEGMSAAQAGGMKGPIMITGNVEQKIVSVSGKTAKIQVNTSALQMAGGMTIGQPQTATTEVDELGNSTGTSEATGYGVHFPRTPVKIGQTWSQSTTLPGMMGASTKASTTYKFNGIKRVGKLNLADISFSIQSGGMLKGGNGHSFLNPADGSLSSLSMKLNLSNPQGGGDLTTTVDVKAAK